MTPWVKPPLPPRLAAARRLPLVGRHRELECLEDVWADVLEGHRQVVFVGGEPGAGKTRLIAEVAGALYDNDVTVLVGSSSPDAGVPYQPFTEMLDYLFDNAPPGSLRELLERGGLELRRLTASVTRHRSDLPDVGEANEVRRDLFDAVAELVAALSAVRPLGIFLDDLHWAQPPTLALLE
ncbi:MAG: AAA family ATPase, partial [Acidimicrobiales bacterium]